MLGHHDDRMGVLGIGCVLIARTAIMNPLSITASRMKRLPTEQVLINRTSILASPPRRFAMATGWQRAVTNSLKRAK